MKMIFCRNCGNKLEEEVNFCNSCGFPLAKQGENQDFNQTESSNRIEINAKSLFDNATRKIGQYAGTDESLNVNLKELFSEVFKKHTPDEAEEIFIAGTKNTTPSIQNVSENWMKPWLFSRIFFVFSIVFIGLYLMVDMYENANAIPGLTFIGAFTVPFSVLIFFFESNVYRNISIFEVVKVFFIGGVLSLLSTLFLYQFITFSDSSMIFGVMTTTDAILVSIVEEVGKAIVIVYFINKYKINKILNGLLIGAAIGAGFAVFESAGYIYQFTFLMGNFLDITMIRVITAFGGHLAWAAITGAAISIVKNNDSFNLSEVTDNRFIFFFLSVIIIHAIWDMGIELLGSNYITYIVLTAVAWIEIFVLMSSGLKQVNTLREAENELNIR
jgi:RsiW-degrading membrane proteinase PrsW (M82 family)/ribosomal protein L37E